MRLVTYRTNGSTADLLGAIVDGDVVDLAAGAGHAGVAGEPPASMLELLRVGETGLRWARCVVAGCAGVREVRRPLAEVRLRAPLPRPNSMRDFMLVEEHVRNSLGSVPAEWYEIPVYWKGNCDAVYGPGDMVPWPGYTEKLDYELELAAVIGRPVRRVSVEEAADCIAGYTIFNDWSARDIQFREMKVGLGPGLGKDFATSLGPCLTTADAIDVASARMWARVNGEVWSEGTLGAMRFSFPEVISHLSQEQTLRPGDVLGSGTVGRGCGLELDRWIAPGDLVELEVEGIGVLGNRVGAKHAAATGVTPARA
jgi:2-keto-4-pentenoate hydratase/2-oxohepta-3-ene-1,7-dioic acid hydratase in catechol pathway